MKHFLPLLLPLLLWVGCEDDNDEANGGSETPFTFSDEFVKHRTISFANNSIVQNSFQTFNYTWDGLNATVIQDGDWGRDTSYQTYNEYGTLILDFRDSTDYVIYNYLDDGWRATSFIFIHEGDTLFTWDWEWDGLTRSGVWGPTTFNQYGQEVAHYEEPLGEWVYHTLSEDGRRMLVRRGSEQCNGNWIAADIEIWTWNGNEVEIQETNLDNCNTVYGGKGIRVYDEYYNVISSSYYSLQDGELELWQTYTSEYDYNSPFTPITLTP